jgi:hypothetical protein
LGWARNRRPDRKLAARRAGIRIAQLGLLVEERADARGRKTATAGEAGIFEGGKSKLDFGERLRFGGGGQLRSGGEVELVGIEAPIARFLDLANERLRLGGEAHAGDP